jgi:tellurite resistance protein
MGRRKGGSAAGMGLLIVLGLIFAALSAVYRFIVENLAAITGFGTVVGLLLILWYLFSKLEGQKSSVAERPLATQQPQIQLLSQRGYVEPLVQFGSRARSAGTSGQTRWVAPTETIIVQGVSVAGGMFYLGTALSFEGREIDEYVVNPELSAKSSRPDVEGTSMPYWPSYAEVAPAARRAFLEWMSTGRQAKPYGIGHVFLYFYGLEHRVFADRDVGNVPALIAEVDQLLRVYGDNGSFQGYATHFLDLARCAAGLPLPVPEPAADTPYAAEMGTAVRLHLGRRLAQSAAILSEDALIWVLALPDVYLRTAAVRCFDKFVPLWHLRFRSRFPEGLRVATSGNIDLSYRAASGAFEVPVDGPHRDYPDVTKVKTSLEPLRQLVQECTDELDGFSRLLGRRPEARNSVQAALLLPEDLLAETVFEALREFGQRLSEIMGGKQLASTKMDTVLRLANFELPDSGKLSPAVADQLGQVLDRLDIAIEPDRRYGGGVPQPQDQVFLFNAPGGGPVDSERPAYRSMKAQVEVAVLAAAADGEASGEEIQLVIAGIKEGVDLGGVERARLISFAITIFNSPPKQARVLKRLADRSPAERATIAKAAVAIVVGDGTVQPDEVRFLEKLHKALGLPKEQLYSELHKAVPRSDEPVAISIEQRQAGIPIPKEAPVPTPDAVVRIRIDAERLARAQRETAEVSELLANIFEEETPPPVETVAAVANASAFEGLDQSHTELVELIELKGAVPKLEFEERARAMKLLAEGALERINDWAFERFDEALLEDGDEIVMAPHLRERLSELRETA